MDNKDLKALNEKELKKLYKSLNRARKAVKKQLEWISKSTYTPSDEERANEFRLENYKLKETDAEKARLIETLSRLQSERKSFEWGLEGDYVRVSYLFFSRTFSRTEPALYRRLKSLYSNENLTYHRLEELLDINNTLWDEYKNELKTSKGFLRGIKNLWYKRCWVLDVPQQGLMIVDVSGNETLINSLEELESAIL